MSASLRRIVSAHYVSRSKIAALSERAIDTWTDRLTKLSSGLDLSFFNDRDTFRKKVEQATRSSSASLIADLARHFGREPEDDSREAASRALARAWAANSS